MQQRSTDRLSPLEQRASWSLALVFGLRMLGLFMLMPVLAIYGQHLDGYSPLWIGLAIGAYGLTQAMMQIPMGLASDRFGRKPVILVGLVIFALGSVVAAVSDSVYGVTIGRALQGAGAIASAVLALAADLSRENQRTKVMAAIGMCIGLSFTLSLIAGPLLVEFSGLNGLFWLTALMAVFAMVVVQYLVPAAPEESAQRRQRDVVAEPGQLKALLRDGQLLRLDLGIFVLHLAITAVFVALPLALVDAGLAAERHWALYLPVVLASFVLMVPVMIISAKQGKTKPYFLAAIALLAASLCLMALTSNQLTGLVAASVLFFAAFNFLEASLPAMISKVAPAGQKGSAMGIYSTSQFFGAFLGGLLGGVMLQWVGLHGVFMLAALLMLLWLVFARGMRETAGTRSLVLPARVSDQLSAQHLRDKLLQLVGVAEANVLHDEGLAYLKVDDQRFDRRAAENLLLKS